MRIRIALGTIAAAALFPASAHGTVLARAFADWNGSSCTSLTWTCSGSPNGTHYSLGSLNLGGSGFLYVDGVLVDSCDFGPGGSCHTDGPNYTWAYDNNGVGCRTALAVTILVAGDIAQDTSTTFGC